MPEIQIVNVEGSAALLVPAAMLEMIGCKIGDKLVADVVDRELVFTPVENDRSSDDESKIVDEMFKRRADAYRRLA